MQKWDYRDSLCHTIFRHRGILTGIGAHFWLKNIQTSQLSETVFEGDDEQADGELNEEDIVIDDEPVEIIDFLISSIGCWDNFPLMITLEMLTSGLLDGPLFDGRLNTGTNEA